MSSIFVPVPGRLVAIKSDHPRGLIFDLGSVQATGVVTSLSVDGSVAAQFQPSLNRTVYLTPFGDNIGSMDVNMVLNSSCTDSEGDTPSKFLDNYEQSRLSPSNPQPANLIIGRKAFTGYAIGFKLSGSSDNGHIIQGQLRFAAWMSL